MPLQFRKEIKLGNFVKVNIGKKSMSLSAGVPGLHFTVGPRGPMVSADLPGGMSYRKYFGRRKSEKAEEPREAKQTTPAPARVEAAAAKAKAAALVEAEAAPPVGDKAAAPVESRAVLPAGDKAAAPVESRAALPAGDKAAAPVESRAVLPGEPAPAAPAVPAEEAPFQLGFIAYQHGDFVQAYRHFTALLDSPYRTDALFMAGITSAYLNRDDEAVTYLVTFLEEGQPPFPGDPESLVTRYLPEATIDIQLTRFTAVDLPLEPAAALLLYVELLQLNNQLDAAAAMLQDVLGQSPEFRLVELSLTDLYFQQGRYDDIYKLLSQHPPELEAEDDVAVETMYYWAQALAARGMMDAADQVYRRALARQKGINPDLRRMVLYGRADLYQQQDKRAQARKVFEEIFAEAPDFYDVQQRIAALADVETAQ